MATKIVHVREATFAPTLSVPTSERTYLFLKRAMDIVLSLFLLLVLSPVMLLVALAIVIDSRGPVIFSQARVLGDQSLGDDHPEARTFKFLKFRSMYQDADQELHRLYMEQLINGKAECSGRKKLYKLDDDPRITRVGRILRKTSLDELPQLLNILRGEMSFVGPRPAIPYEVCQYKPWYNYRLTVTQGLTGLWQVRGRNELSFEEMMRLDIEYARKRSLWFDIKILTATIPAVLSARGVR